MRNISSGPNSDFRLRLLLALVLAAVACWLFWPAVHHDFLHYDDGSYVFENPNVQQGLTWSGIRWAFTTVYENWWLPLLWISFMLDTSLFGPGPFGYHLVNILLHACNAGLLFWVFSRMTKSIWASAFVAALFAFHHMRIEAVAWITARKDVLSGLFYLLALLAYLRYVDRPSMTRLSIVASLMFLGLMSKAILITLPPILLLLDFWPLRRAGDPLDRREWKAWGHLLIEKIPLFLLAALFVDLNLKTHRTGSAAYAVVPPLDRLGLVFPNYWTYLGKLVWPTNLAVLYPEHDVVRWGISLTALAGLVAVTWLVLRQRNRRPHLLVGWLWFLVALLPVIRGLRLGYAAYADRFTYIPSIGLFLLLAWSAADVLPRRPGRTLFLAGVAGLLLAACAFQTRAVLPLWKNSVAAFENVLAHSPDYPLANNNLGAYYASTGQPEKALPYLLHSVRIQPGYAQAQANLARLYMEAGRIPDAIAHYRAAVKSEPERVEAVNNLAWLLATASGASPAQYEEALRYALRAVELLKSRPASALDTLAAAYAANGQFGEAIQTAEQALRQAQADGESGLAGQIARRLATYRLNLPWRE